ncbi:tRNA (adenosine(37)-N6)-threonylcarbamoyltransferase complex transferase subunit TsaD [Candidatus Peregrinibacteria bacterium CG1_02_54_53]|nr:MAG: tRNA (adenosine(37)-N6)-threonylcarbamoyltransferase complex transferase subunit TsaD [Candidatus Peregrinibacteria bacterium CG1_02_54_53]
MITLGIETSCDETSAAIVADGTQVLSCIIASSKDAFEHAGGVIPEHAAREQIRSIHPVIDQALAEASVSPKDIDLIAVTRGPGLLGSLLVGTVTARTLATLWKKPLIGVHHTLGHLSSSWLDTNDEPQFPVLTLSASGGHTELWLRTDHLQGELLGSTRDDAAGEAFDKGASLLGLPYPGGPSISQAGQSGDPQAYPFPRPLHGEPTLDFSYSGLKTALKYLLRDLPDATSHTVNLAASYEYALCRHLADRIAHALDRHDAVQEVHVVGGVSANSRLRAMLTEQCAGRVVRFPTRLLYCTDNAAMIASAGTFLRNHIRQSRGFATAASLPAGAVFS